MERSLSGANELGLERKRSMSIMNRERRAMKNFRH